jgi:hypothetical protein
MCSRSSKSSLTTFSLRLMVDSAVLHTLARTEALEMQRVFPRMPPRVRPARKAYKNNLSRHS